MTNTQVLIIISFSIALLFKCTNVSNLAKPKKKKKNCNATLRSFFSFVKIKIKIKISLLSLVVQSCQLTGKLFRICYMGLNGEEKTHTALNMWLILKPCLWILCLWLLPNKVWKWLLLSTSATHSVFLVGYLWRRGIYLWFMILFLHVPLTKGSVKISGFLNLFPY